MAHAGSNSKGDVLFMEVCQKLGGLSLVGMGGCESTHLWCMLGVIQREMFSLWRCVRNWEVSVWLGWGMRKHLFVVHAGSNARGDVLFMEVCQKLGGLSLVGMGMRKHLFVVHAGSNTRGDVLFMEVCQKLGGLSLVGMGDVKALICGACWEQYKGRCSLYGGMSETVRSQFGWDGG